VRADKHHLRLSLRRRVTHLEQLRRRRVRVGHAVLETTLDHLERQEVLPLLAQDPAKAFHVGLIELAVAGRRALGDKQASALEEADLRDGDVREFLAEQGKDIANCKVGALPHWGLSLRSWRGKRA
jgi:hypothetical protein